MDSRVNVFQNIEGGEPLAPGEEPRSPFVLNNLFQAFVEGSVGASLTAAAPSGVSIFPNLNIDLFTSVISVFDVIVPVPVVTVKTATLLENFARITSPFGTLNNGPFKFGIDVSGFESAVSVLTFFLI